MTRLVGQPLHGGNLTESQAHSSTAATCDVPRVIGGANRLWYEMVHGKVPAANSQCSPERACGGVGHDHTGGGMGRPLVHSVYSVVYPDATNQAASTILAIKPPAIYRTGAANPPYGSIVVTYIVPVPAAFPGSEYEALSAQAAFYVSAYTDTISITGYISNEQVTGNDNGPSFEIELSGTGWYTFASPVAVSVIPGVYNRIKLHFTIADNPTTAYLQSFTLAQLT